MRYPIRYRLILAAAAVAILFTSGAHALSGDVTLSIRMIGSGPFLPGIPILLQVSARNTGKSDATIPDLTLSSRDNPFNSVDILTGPADSAKLARVEYVLPNFGPWKAGIVPVPPPQITLKPGETRDLLVPLSHNWKPDNTTLLFTEGRWQVQAALCDYGPDAEGNPGINHNDNMTSPKLDITITPPEGGEAKAWARAKESERPWLLAHPAAMVHLAQNEDFRRFQDIANMNSGVYSRYAAAVVAYMYAQGNGLDLHSGRPPQPAVAKQWIDKAMSGKSATTYPPDWTALAERLGALEEKP